MMTAVTKVLDSKNLDIKKEEVKAMGSKGRKNVKKAKQTKEKKEEAKKK
ncbi:MAG: hypothetical protein HYU83_05575 [Chloroflexi bacterium]|nr:hypothetical protein [Chloroflexota bacterium]